MNYLKENQLKKNGRLKTPIYKSKEYLSWCHSQNFGCIVCGAKNIHLHHVDNGIGRRSDDTIIILCQAHHQGKFSPHGFNSNLFYEKFPKDKLLQMAKELHEEWKSETE